MEFFFSSLVFSRFRSSMCVCVCASAHFFSFFFFFLRKLKLLCFVIPLFALMPSSVFRYVKFYGNYLPTIQLKAHIFFLEQKKYLKFLFFAQMLKIPKFYLFLRNQQNRQKREKFKFIPKEDNLLEPGCFCHGKRALLECWSRVSIVTFIHLSLSTNISRKDIYRLPFTWGAKEIQTNSIYAVKYYC